MDHWCGKQLLFIEEEAIMMKALIVGAGNRGVAYTRILNGISDVCISGICDPRTPHRDALVEECKNAETIKLFNDWREAAALPEKIADFVIIAIQDRYHRECTEAFAKRGYNILLEKPMAATPQDCEAIVAAVKKAGVLFGVCHVLRYTPYWTAFKRLIDSGAIGEITNIQHLEAVGYWHMAHSFVRGNWRDAAESSPILLAKSCHDIDILRYLAGRPCLRVSSFGTLGHFNEKNRPAGAAKRCMDCPAEIEKRCPYSAIKIYWRDRAEKGIWGWPVDIVTRLPGKENLFLALREGPYGRCVYACDNNVCDRQTVNLEFDGGLEVSFTLSAFTSIDVQRRTMVCGTRGMLVGDGQNLEIHDFLTNQTTSENVVKAASGNITDGHGGGDYGLIQSFLQALRTDNLKAVCTGADETLESHRIIFAAEKSRIEHKDILLSDL